MDTSLDMTFTAPAAPWTRRTILVFDAPDDGEETEPPSVVVIREAMTPGESLEGSVHRHLAELRRLPRSNVRSCRQLTVDMQPAVEIVHEWLGPDAVLEQTTTLIESAGDAGRALTNVTTTCARERADELRLFFARVVASIRFEPRRRSSGIALAPASQETPPEPAAPSTPRMPYIPIPGTNRRRPS